MDESLPSIDPQVRQFWADAIERHARWLRRSAHARLGDSHAAEDVVQEVNLAAMRQTEVLPSVAQVTAWFASVLSRQTALWYRKQKRGEVAVQNFVSRQVSPATTRDENELPEKGSLQQETINTVSRAIGELESPRKEIVLLKLVEGKTYQEIAQQLGLTRHVVEYQFSQGRRKLRHQLANWIKES